MIGPFEELFWGVFSKVHYYLTGSYTHRVAACAWDLFAQLWYFWVLGIVVTAFISVFWRKNEIASFLRRSPRGSIVTATLVGIFSPMPTYVAIPLIAALFRVGVHPAPLFAFLVSSPLMNPILFSLTAGAFGYEMAVSLTLSAFALGITAGLVTQLLVSRNHFSRFLCNGGSIVESVEWKDSTKRTLKSYAAEFSNQLYRNTKFISKYFFLGIIIAAAVKVLIPASWIISTLGNQRSFSVLVAVAAGVPLYACGGGTIPVMQTLQQLGMDKGAILAFFISGPATKLSTLVALKAAVRKEVFLLYLTIGFLGASVFGLAYSIW
ncbi:MAG: permease [Candidatus Zixiibacteriota bacterium]